MHIKWIYIDFVLSVCMISGSLLAIECVHSDYYCYFIWMFTVRRAHSQFFHIFRNILLLFYSSCLFHFTSLFPFYSVLFWSLFFFSLLFLFCVLLSFIEKKNYMKIERRFLSLYFLLLVCRIVSLTTIVCILLMKFVAIAAVVITFAAVEYFQCFSTLWLLQQQKEAKKKKND